MVTRGVEYIFLIDGYLKTAYSYIPENSLKSNHFPPPPFETAQCEKYIAQTLINGAKKLGYEFNSQKNQANQQDIIVIKSIINIMPSTSRADSVFEKSITGYKIGLSLNRASYSF